MVYIILNGLLAVFLVCFSYYIDKNKIDQGLMINSTLLLFSYVLCNFLSLIMIHYFSNYTITFVLVEMGEILENFFVLNLCLNILIFPATGKHRVMILVEAVLVVLLGYSVFRYSIGIVTSPEMGVSFYSDYLSPAFTYRWLDVWKVMSHYVIPGITTLYIIVRPANTKTRLDAERLLVNLLALVVVAASYPIFVKATEIAPFFYSLRPFGYLVALLLVFMATKIYVLFDVKSLLFRSLQLLWLYIVPALVLGVITAFILGYRRTNLALYTAVLVVLMVAILLRTNSLPKIFSRRNLSFAVGYEQGLEQKFAVLDYNLSLESFGNQVHEILSGEVKSTGMNVLISNGTEFSSVYSSYQSISSLPLDFPAFEVMMSVGRQVAFKNQLNTYHALAGAKTGLTELFDQSNSQACILLAEGYRVFGVILLGEKRLGNDYTNADYKTFTKLYPYFFMIGYYMNSVANEGVIGTINREIKMSDQIVHSIQENMDFIRNPKVDVGYMMIPARNIGGEFIDFIRLTDTRHIMILGSMSGKGITASMSMVIMKSIIRTFLTEIHDFKDLIQKVNHFIRFNLPRGTFFAGVFALLDFTDNTMYYINCGVPALMLYTQSYNNVIEIQGDGRVLGFVPDVSGYVKVKKVKLNPGDLVFACTDGLIDSHSLRGESFGKARIQKCIMDNLNYSANKINQFTYETLNEFTSREPEADITCLTMKVFAAKEAAGGTA